MKLAAFLALALFCAVPARGEDALIVLIGGFTIGADPDLRIGTELAIEDLRQTTGFSIRLQFEDDERNPVAAANAAQRAIAQRPALVLDTNTSPTVIAAAPFLAQADILHITPNATNPGLTELGVPTLFRMIGRDDRQGEAAGKLLAERWRNKRIAILEDGGLYGRTLAVYAARALAAPPALSAHFDPDSADYAALVKRLLDARIEAIFIGAYGDAAARLIVQLRDAGYAGAIIGPEGLGSSYFKQRAGRYAEGVLFTAPSDPPANAALAERIRDAGGTPSAYAFCAYAAIQVWAEAAKRARSLDGLALSRQIHEGSFDTVLGNIAFDAKGDIAGEAAEWRIHRWTDGKITSYPK